MLQVPKQRILIFGLPGSGKSTFADELAKHLKLPLHHLDAHFFVEGWQERPKEEFFAIHQELIAQDKWIIDGNAMAALEPRYARATHVYYFRLPRLLCLWRVFKRRLQIKRNLPDRAPGCSEKMSWHLIKYLWQFHSRYGAQIEALRSRYPHVHFEIRDHLAVNNEG